MKLLVQFRIEDGIVGKSEYEIVSQWQSSSARMLAITEAGQESLKFLNRQGVLQANMRLLYPVQSLCWNRDGEYVAISFQPRQSRVWVVNARSKQYDEYDMGRQLHASFIMWCRNQDLLAACSNKGHTFLFDHSRKDNQCFMGKHERGVVAGDWSSNNQLATISEDKCVSVMDLQGNIVCHFEHTASHASSLKFPQTKSSAFALILASKVLLLCQLPANTATAATGTSPVANGYVKDGHKPLAAANSQTSQVRLSFDASYGDIVDFYWHQEDFLVIAFSKGYVIEVSTRADEISTELWHCQVFGGHLSTFSMIPASSLRLAMQQQQSMTTVLQVAQTTSSSASSSLAASVANNQHKFAASDGNLIKIFDARTPNTPQATLQEQTETSFTRLEWTCDGELLLAIGNSGQCYFYLSSIKQLGSAYFTQFAYLAGGLGEVMVADEVLFPGGHNKLQQQQQNDFEPSMLGIGPSMMLAAANNFVHYYSVLTPTEAKRIEQQQQQSKQQSSNRYQSGTNAGNNVTFRIEHIHLRQFYHEVVSIVLNRYMAAFLFDNGKILVHSLPPLTTQAAIEPFIAALNSNPSNKSRTIRLNDDFIDETTCVFPDSFRNSSNNNSEITNKGRKNLQLFADASHVQFTCVEASSEYVAIGADDGTVFLFSCLDTLHIGPIAQFQHTSSIVKLALHPRLPIVVAIDVIGHVVLFDALNDAELAVSVMTSAAAGPSSSSTQNSSANTMMRARGVLFNCGQGGSAAQLRNAGGDQLLLSDAGSGEDCSFIVYDDREVSVLVYKFDSVDGPRLVDVRAALANPLPTFEGTSAVLVPPSVATAAERAKGGGGKKSVSGSKTSTLPRFALPLAFHNATVWVLRQDGQLFAKRLDHLYPSEIAERVLATVTIKESEIVDAFPWSGAAASNDGATGIVAPQRSASNLNYDGRRNLIEDIRKCVAIRKERQALRLISILLKTDAANNIDLLPSGGAAITTTAVNTMGSTAAASTAPATSSYSTTSSATAQLLQAIAQQFVEELQLEAAVYIYRLLRQVANVWQLEEIMTSCADDRLVMKATVAMFLKRFDDAERHYLQAQQPEAALQMRCNLLDWARGSQLAKEYAPKQLPLISYQYGMQLEFSGDYANALTQFERGMVDNGDVQNSHNRVLLKEAQLNPIPIHVRITLRQLVVARCPPAYSKCYAGIARTCARINNVQRALGICAKLQDTALSLECAQQMEAANAFSEAGQLYESIQQYERAAATYLRAKDWTKLQSVLFIPASSPIAQEAAAAAAARPSTVARRSVVIGSGLTTSVANPAVRNPQLFQAYAKRQEDSNKFDEACRAYEAGGYYEDVVRLFLRDNVNKIDQAIKLVEQRRSRGAALLLANYLAKQRNDIKAALRLLVHVGCDEEAFKFAQQHSLVHVYADVVGTQASSDIYKSIALYFEGEQRNNLKAGKFFLLAGMYARAVRVILRELTSPQAAQKQQQPVDAGEKGNNDVTSHPQDEELRVLVQAAVQSKEKSLVTQTESFLLGQLDGIARDPYYLYRLYMESKAYREAAKTAVVVARHHIQDSEYDRAHDLLRATCTELIATTTEKFFIPLDLRQLLLMIHSRKLAVLHSRLGDFQLAAHLLKRIVDNASLFPPQDAEKLLWSYYTICGKAQFKVAAYEMAKRLNEMARQKSEAAKTTGSSNTASNNVELPEKYRNAIFQTLRRGNPQQQAGGGNDPTLDDEMCIFAWSPRALDVEPRDFSHSFSPLLLTCPYCENTLPFCSLTGLRMTIDNFGLCSKCSLPIAYSKAVELLTRSNNKVPSQCLLCNCEWTIAQNDDSFSNEAEQQQHSSLRKLSRKQVFDFLDRTWVSSTTAATGAATTSGPATSANTAVASYSATQRERTSSSVMPAAATIQRGSGALLVQT